MKKRTSNMWKSIPAVFIIIMGAAVEIVFYHYKFIADGWPAVGAYIAGGAATVFLVYLSTKINLFSIIAMIGLVAFSVFCTISGQAYFYAHITNQQLTDASADIGVIDTIADLESEIDKLRSSRDAKQIELDALSDSDRWTWQIAGTNADGSAAYQKAESPLFLTLNNEITRLDTQITQKEDLLYELKLNNNVTTDQVSEDTYKYISDRVGVGQELLMFGMRLLLSLVFAAMAPYGFNRLVAIWKPHKQKTRLRDIIDKITTIKYDRIMEKLDEPKQIKTGDKSEFDYLNKNNYIGERVRNAKQGN